MNRLLRSCLRCNQTRITPSPSIRHQTISRTYHSHAMSDLLFTSQRHWQTARFGLHGGITKRTYATSGGYGGPGISSMQVVWGIIGLNAAVFGAWQYAKANRDVNLITNLSRNFTASVQNFKSGRYWTLITPAFSHENLPHFAFNMISFHAFGTILSVCGIGPARMLSLCLGSAIVGNASFLYQKQSNVSPLGRAGYGLGASGVVMGAAAAATCLMPFAPMQLFFIPVNIPLWMITIVYAGVDTYYLHSNSPVGHSAHLGGSIFGAAFYFVYLRRLGGIWRMFGGRR